jgi:hypothetical protein
MDNNIKIPFARNLFCQMLTNFKVYKMLYLRPVFTKNGSVTAR